MGGSSLKGFLALGGKSINEREVISLRKGLMLM